MFVQKRASDAPLEEVPILQAHAVAVTGVLLQALLAQTRWAKGHQTPVGLVGIKGQVVPRRWDQMEIMWFTVASAIHWELKSHARVKSFLFYQII